MRKYIVFKEVEENGPRYYILQRDFPHFVGMIIDNPYMKSILKVPVPQTTFFIAFNGTLRGNMIPAYKQIEEEIKHVYIDMAMWYYVNIIEPNPKKYKKWLLTAEPTT